MRLVEQVGGGALRGRLGGGERHDVGADVGHVLRLARVAGERAEPPAAVDGGERRQRRDQVFAERQRSRAPPWAIAASPKAVVVATPDQPGEPWVRGAITNDAAPMPPTVTDRSWMRAALAGDPQRAVGGGAGGHHDRDGQPFGLELGPAAADPGEAPRGGLAGGRGERHRVGAGQQRGQVGAGRDGRGAVAGRRGLQQARRVGAAAGWRPTR